MPIRGRRVSGHTSALVLSLVLAIAASVPVRAQQTQQTQQTQGVHIFSVHSSDPASEIRALSSQAGIQILASADDLKGKRFNPISGTISTKEALNDMLEGTGLKYRYVGDHAVALVSNDKSAKTKEHLAGNETSSASHSQSRTSKERGAARKENSAPASSSANDPKSKAPDTPEEPAELQQVTVTARKRRESIQDVPISITSVDSNFIQSHDITAISQIARFVPNTYMTPTDAVGSTLGAYIRGIGNRTSEPTQDQAVVESIDGIYLTSLTDSALGIFDVANIEVDRGPQGVLQGRNAPGGSINITSRRPSGDFGGNVDASYGSFNQAQLQGALEAPLVSGVLAGRVAFFGNSGGNYMTNITTGGMTAGGHDNEGGRVGLLFTPSNNLTAYWTADFEHDNSPQNPLRPIPQAVALSPLEPSPVICTRYHYCSPLGEYETAGEYIAPEDAKTGGTGLSVNWALGQVTFTSVTGYRFAHDITNLDDDAEPVIATEIKGRKQDVAGWTQEFRLASDANRRFSYLLGLYYSNSQVSLYSPLVSNAGASSHASYHSQQADSYAGFGQAVYRLTARWSVSAGTRETLDRKFLFTEPTIPGPSGRFSNGYSNLSSEAGTEYHFADDVLGYFRFSQGYRAGGINGAASSLAATDFYKPEVVNSYELGLKSTSLDNRLVVDAAIFDYDYKNLQLSVLQAPVGGNLLISVVDNVPGMRGKGVELDSRFLLTPGLLISGSAGYLDTQYIGGVYNLGFGPINLATLQKDNAPKFTGYLSADYSRPIGGDAGGVLTFSGNVHYQSTILMSPTPAPISFQAGYALVGASVSYQFPDSKHEVAVYGDNLTDKYYKLGGETGSNQFAWDDVGPPRTFGVRVSWTF